MTPYQRLSLKSPSTRLFVQRVVDAISKWKVKATHYALLSLCEMNPPVAVGFPSQRDSNAESMISIYIYIYNLDSVQYFENIYGGYYHFWCWNRNIQGWQGGYHHWNGAVVMVTALIITGDVEGKLQRLQWISRLTTFPFLWWALDALARQDTSSQPYSKTGLHLPRPGNFSTTRAISV